MQIIKHDINVDFVGKRKLALIVSAVVIFIGLASLVVNGGPNYGIDFVGIVKRRIVSVSVQLIEGHTCRPCRGPLPCDGPGADAVVFYPSYFVRRGPLVADAVDLLDHGLCHRQLLTR